MKTLEQEHSQMVNQLAKDGHEILASLTPVKCHLWHMVTGVMGEVIELKDYTDMENLVEELGDLEFYLRAIREHYDIPYLSIQSKAKPMINAIDDVVSASGELIDNMKKELIYNKSKFNDIEQSLIDINIAMCHIYYSSGITREDALRHNINKLLKGKGARYSSGEYTDKQAQERSDKQ